MAGTMSTSTASRLVGLTIISLLTSTTSAHEHHMEDIPEGEGVSAEPLDTILWIHILAMMLSFGIIFPTGMVLGLVKNRWHVPVQVLGTIIAVMGYFLGHNHKGRQFAPTAHASFSNWLMLMLIVQITFGAYLRLHLEKGINGKIRKVAKIGHGLVGKLMPVAAWVQMVFGGIAALGFCRGEHTGQCAAHFIMGSAFIGYGIFLIIMLLCGQAWLRRTKRSQEFYDSALIAAWGCVNTFTEHRWGGAWVENDIQHTTMGVIWWAAGLAGVWLSRDSQGRPKRNFIPGFVIFITGWAMSGHPQHLMLSTMVHQMFGYTLMAAGLTRIIEISFVLRDAANVGENGEHNSWQYIPTYLLIAAGFVFMSATEEQMALIAGAGITHVAYILVLYSFAFIVFLFVNILVYIYTTNSKPVVPPKDIEGDVAPHANGSVPQMGARDDRRVRDAEEYELEGLMSDEEDDEPLSSPSTVGKNNHGRAD